MGVCGCVCVECVECECVCVEYACVRARACVRACMRLCWRVIWRDFSGSKTEKKKKGVYAEVNFSYGMSRALGYAYSKVGSSIHAYV